MKITCNQSYEKHASNTKRKFVTFNTHISLRKQRKIN